MTATAMLTMLGCAYVLCQMLASSLMALAGFAAVVGLTSATVIVWSMFKLCNNGWTM